jgi:thermostable 8-oxoguanine DNA glycosylase
LLTTIEPQACTAYNRSDAELQQFWLFSLLVAGKNADRTAKVLDNLLRPGQSYYSPFDYLVSLTAEELVQALKACRVGQYHRLSRAITESLDLNLRKATVAELDCVYGVGRKTASFFVLHTRRDAHCAVLDTHILAWMASLNIGDIPRVSPSDDEKYTQLERLFMHLAAAYWPGRTLAEIDLLLWKAISGREQVQLPTLDGLYRRLLAKGGSRKTEINVNRHVIAANKKLKQDTPPLSAKTYKGAKYGRCVIVRDTDGREALRLVYRPHDPLSCGATVWGYTNFEVEVHETEPPG